MEFRYGLLADYATRGANGKEILVGVWEGIVHLGDAGPIPIPESYLVVLLNAHVYEGTTHEAEFLLVDEDSAAQMRSPKVTVSFTAQGPRLPLRGSLIVRLQGLHVPGPGTYAFHIIMDGRQVGQVPFHVTLAPKQA